MSAFKFSDLLIMIASFMAATAITSYQIDTLTLEQFLQMRIKVVNFILFISLLILWHSLFSMFGLYRSRRLGTIKREIIDIVKAPMRELGLSHIKKIRAALARKKRSPRQQQYVFRTFSMVWDAARDHGLVMERSPTKSNSFRLPKVDNERQRYLTSDEEKRLFDAIEKRSRPVHDMAVIALDMGMRFGEIAGLTWSCVDVDQRIVRVLDSKGRDRFVPMTDRVKGLFESMGQGRLSDFIFPAKSGKQTQQIPSSFVRAVADAKLNDGIENPKMRASFHTLRHTAASRLVQSGVDLYRVQRLLGHSTPVMTARYSKLADDDLKQAVKRMEDRYRLLKEKNDESKVIPFKQAQ